LLGTRLAVPLLPPRHFCSQRLELLDTNQDFRRDALGTYLSARIPDANR
jgi:hypothetical protein